MRERGSRAFWVRAEPVDGYSLAHPKWDRVWAAATDLGMVAALHVGNTPTDFSGWANAGWELEGGTGLIGLFRYNNSLRHHAAEKLLLGLAFGGTFGRNPNLTFVIEELQLAWLPPMLWRCQSLDIAGPWPFDRAPSEMLRHNIRTTPLLSMGDREYVQPMMELAPEMLVFSSDYPHGEGNADPIRLYEPEFIQWEEDRRNAFLGGNILECYARMGDPLTVLP